LLTSIGRLTDSIEDTVCGRAQRALIERCVPEAAADVRAHVETCAECGFLRGLSRNLTAPTATSNAVGRGALWPFVDVFDRAVETGEILLSRYRLLARVGLGGQGAVYRATDTHTRETVALKLIHCRPGPPETASDEVALAHRIRHTGVCRVYHTERHGDLRWISMEFISGGSLNDIKDTLSPADRRRVFRQVCLAIQAAHQAGVLHLDIKPQNILFRSLEEPIVTDFGLATSTGSRNENVVSTGGTPGYMAPEQLRGGPVDARTDVYALGVLLRELFPRPSWHIGRAIERAVAAEPGHRFPSAAALLSAVELPGRVRSRLRVVSLALVVLPFLALIPAPLPRRAPWSTEFGRDTLPADAWNVAVNDRGAELPSVAASRPPVACARNVRELNDGLAYYSEWNHGYAFAGAVPICVHLWNVPTCGPLREEADLCVMEGSDLRRLGARVRDRGRFASFPPEAFGQVEEAGDCRSDDEVTVTLARPEIVFAARAWYHTGIPTRYRVSVEGDDGEWATVFETNEGRPENRPSVWSFPVTTTFAPVRARRLRLNVRCDLRDPWNPERPGENVWLYELEVFARLSRFEAWRRHLIGK
jgi:protein kinase-like protein